MKPPTWLAAALLVCAQPAFAQPPPGINLAWDDCYASLALGLNKTSTCLSNTETQKTLYGSYVLSADVGALAGNEIVMDILTNSATLPCWWNFTKVPRTTASQMQFDTPCPDAGGVGIFDYWSSIPGGPTATSTAMLMPTVAVPRIRIIANVAVGAGQAQPVPASTGEIYSFTFRLKHDGTATCAGCLTPACFILQGVRVTQVGSPVMELFYPSSRQFAYWQGGVVQAPGCFLSPAVNRTWGAVKALYR